MKKATFIISFFMVQESIKHFPIPLRNWLKVLAKGQFLVLILVIPTFIITAFAETIEVPLVYPQKSNSPKRQTQKIEEATILKGEVFIDVRGIKSEQQKNPYLYVEYYLDNELIYSTEDKPKPTSLGFILDTLKYPNGEYTLVVNLWDPDGPSAIGISKLIIQNPTQNEE